METKFQWNWYKCHLVFKSILEFFTSTPYRIVKGRFYQFRLAEMFADVEIKHQKVIRIVCNPSTYRHFFFHLPEHLLGDLSFQFVQYGRKSAGKIFGVDVFVDDNHAKETITFVSETDTEKTVGVV